jgi:hypothetical protein
MKDPTRRPPGAWPRDRPIDWPGVAGGVGWFIVDTAAFILQLLLAIPLLIVAGSSAGDALGGAARILLALAWGAASLFATWSWMHRRRRVVLAPLCTIALLLAASNAS